MSGYNDDIEYERRFSSTIAGILGKQFIVQDAELDWKHATDFAIFNVRPFKVAARLRTADYLRQYPFEFTLRWSRPSGVETEIDKVRRGLVDYMIYGFINEERGQPRPDSRIVHYFIGDLGAFRANEPKPICVKWNTPPDSQLAAYRVKDVPGNFVLKSWPGEWAGTTRTPEHDPDDDIDFWPEAGAP
jgi:hypothetical protein